MWAVRVASCLGEGWAAEPSDEGQFMSGVAWLNGPKRQRLTIDLGREDMDRAEIRWFFPNDLRDHQGRAAISKRITVSKAKAPRSVSGDIVRRLLPGLAEVIETASARKVEYDRAVSAAADVTARLHGIVGGRVDVDRHTIDFGRYTRGSINGGVRVNRIGGMAVRVEVDSLSPDQAAQVLSLVAAFGVGN
jgi:hypothetical protein